MKQTCGRCGAAKDQEKNFTYSNARQKYQSFCKACNKLYQQGHYRSNKTTYLSKMQKRRDEWSSWWAEVKKGLRCSCGENHPACLDFHHRDPKKKDLEVSVAVHNGWSKERILREMAKCDVICSNCHRKLHYVALSSNG